MECEYTYIESERSSQKRGRFDKGRATRTCLVRGHGLRTVCSCAGPKQSTQILVNREFSHFRHRQDGRK